MLFILGFYVLYAGALPLETQLQQASQNHTLLWDTIVTGWSDNPSFRGTSSILWSCLVTIVASVYTAIHVNIPLKHMDPLDRYMGKAKWAFVALIAPELVLQAAFIQRRDARKLIRELERICEEQNPSSESNEQNKTRPNLFIRCWERLKFLEHRRKARSKSNFNMAYGFWVIMGGFYAEIKDIHGDHSRVILTARGVTFLAEHHYSIRLPKEQVADRSKASALAKLLVCIQVLWLLLQVFVRLAAEYPLTLLEIHATVHVVCALCIYILWWHKPLDVDEPIPIDDSRYKDILAYMLMASLSTERANRPKSNPALTRSPKYPSSDDPAGIYFHQPELNMLILDTTKLVKEIDVQVLETSLTNFSDAATQKYINSPILIDGENQKMQDSVIQQLDTGSHPGKKRLPRILREVFIPSTSTKEVKEPEEITLAAAEFHPCGFAFDSTVEVSIKSTTVRRWTLCAKALARPGFLDQRRNDHNAGKRQQVDKNNSNVEIEMHDTNKTKQERLIRTMGGKNGKGKSDEKSKTNDNNNIVKGWRLGKLKNEYFVGTKMTSGDIIGFSLELTFASIPFHIATLLLPLLYGGIHLAARHMHFPSATESLLWQISAITVMVFAPSCYLFGFSCLLGMFATVWISDFIVDKMPSKLEPRVTGQARETSRAILTDSVRDIWNGIGAVFFIGVPFTLMILMFALSRLYLVVESFISLRSIPLGALAATPWVQDIPHL